MDGYGVDPEHELDKEDAEFVDVNFSLINVVPIHHILYKLHIL